MSKALTTEKFDYAAIDKEDGGKLKCLANEIRKVSKQHKESGLVVGKAVCDAHEILAKAGKEGQFSSWVESECMFSRATAYNYMNVYERFGECEVIDQFDQGALYVLAQAKVPEEAVKEAVKSAKKGKHFNSEEAKVFLAKFGGLVKKTAPNARVTGAIVQPLDNSTPTEPPAAAPVEEQKIAPPAEPTPPIVDNDFTRNVAKGESAQEVADARSKTVKTAEALMRAFDDLNQLAKHPKEHANAIATCKILLKTAREWA